MKLGILGGSFNPPHPGHIRAAEGAMQSLGLDRVLMIPAGIPPHKELAVGSPDGAQRLEMCRIAARGLDRVEVSDMELRRDGKSYTVETLEILHDKYPGDELYLIMGMDMYLSLDKWYMPEKICSLATIAPSCRESADRGKTEKIFAMTKKLQDDYGARILTIPLDFIEVSSTTARRMLVFGCGESCLDNEVCRYIYENGLYSTGTKRKSMDADSLRRDIYSLLDAKRVAHVAGCEKEAVSLAVRWGEDVCLARRAAILHDVTKALKFSEQLILSETYDMMSNIDENGSEAVKHAQTGAIVAREIYGECNEVCSAVRWHTTGRAGMSRLEKIIYLADYIEPNRSFDGVEAIRRLAYEDLDECLRRSLKNNLDYLKAKGKAIHPATRQAYEFISQQ